MVLRFDLSIKMSQIIYQQYKAEGKEITSQELSKLVAQRWREMSIVHRAPYQMKADRHNAANEQKQAALHAAGYYKEQNPTTDHGKPSSPPVQISPSHASRDGSLKRSRGRKGPKKRFVGLTNN